MLRIENRLAIVTAVTTWFLLIAGALVTSTGSGLSVPDWPLSYGQWMPPMVGGVFFEHGHRMVAGTVALLMAALTFVVAGTETRRWVKVLAFVGLALVLIQATLGGLTVLLRLPPAVSISHAILGQSFFCLTVVLACVTSPGWEGRAPGYRPGDRGLFAFSAVISTLFLVQLFLGASVRHLHAGLAIPDFPTVYGGFLPPVWGWEIGFHFAHRMGAYLLCILSIALAFRIVSREKSDRVRVFLAVSLIGLIASQILLGALTIWLRRPVAITSAHLAIGALCLAISVLMTFRLGWASIPAPRKYEAVPGGALESL